MLIKKLITFKHRKPIQNWMTDKSEDQNLGEIRGSSVITVEQSRHDIPFERLVNSSTLPVWSWRHHLRGHSASSRLESRLELTLVRSEVQNIASIPGLFSGTKTSRSRLRRTQENRLNLNLNATLFELQLHNKTNSTQLDFYSMRKFLQEVFKWSYSNVLRRASVSNVYWSLFSYWGQNLMQTPHSLEKNKKKFVCHCKGQLTTFSRSTFLSQKNYSTMRAACRQQQQQQKLALLPVIFNDSLYLPESERAGAWRPTARWKVPQWPREASPGKGTTSSSTASCLADSQRCVSAFLKKFCCLQSKKGKIKNQKNGTYIHNW